MRGALRGLARTAEVDQKRDLCLSLFAWAPAANARAGIKLHTLLDLRGNIPTFVRITGALVSDASFLDHLRLEAGVMFTLRA